MRPVVAIALFCESIRAETSGGETLVGIMPDNVNIPEVPSIIPKLALYVRLQIDPNLDPGLITLLLETPDSKEQRLMEVDRATVEEARASARNEKKSFAGVICRVEMTPFPVPTLGRLSVIVQTAAEKIIAGALNFVTREAAGPSKRRT